MKKNKANGKLPFFIFRPDLSIASEHSNGTKKHKIVSIPTLCESFLQRQREEQKASNSMDDSEASDECDIESESIMAQGIPGADEPIEADLDSIESNPLNDHMSNLMNQNNAPKLHPGSISDSS